jgi:Zn-finger nucleic acid-binding protein
MDLTCPKCRASMRTYERGGITVDQCTECRGIFLDRGELEHLIDAETAFNSGRGPGAAPGAAPAFGSPQSQQPPPVQYRRYDSDRPRSSGQPRYDSDRPYQQGYGGKRKKSFLEQLFD